MIYTAISREFCAGHFDYRRTITFDAANDVELDTLLQLFADGHNDPRITIDDSNKPQGIEFGSCCRLESFTDANGRDVRHLGLWAF